MKENQEDFFKIAKYLTEEKVIALKPHCAILNSLQKVASAKCKERTNELSQYRKDLASRIDTLIEKRNLTSEENAELADIGRKIEAVDIEREETLRLPKK